MSALAYILAGEPSGDTIAAALMRSQKGRAVFHGIGGPLMKAEGLLGTHDYSALHIMGLAQAIRHYSALNKLMAQLVEEVCTLRPEVIYTVDAKAFSLRFARLVRENMAQEGWQAKLIHVVAPTIWAYGAGRKAAFESVFDGMLCLFPMERDLFDETKLSVRYIGHPAAYQPADKGEVTTKTPNILLLPGSRKSEINALLPIFLQTITKIREHTACDVSICTIESQKSHVQAIAASYGEGTSIITGQDKLKQAFATHHAMLAASGTVTLEAALAGIAGLVAYRLNPLVAYIMTRRFRQKDPVLPNIIMQDEVYPFFFQGEVNAARLSEALSTLLADKKAGHHMAQKSDRLRKMLTSDAATFEDAIAKALLSIG